MADDSSSLVPRGELLPAVRQQISAAPYDPEKHNGMRNPYTGRTVTCEADYQAYLEEYVYHRLCDDLLRRQYDQQLRGELQRVSSQSIRETSRLRCSLAAVIAAAVLALAAVLFLLVPHVRETAFSSGETSGYSIGFDAGETSGYESGYTDGAADGYLDGLVDGSGNSKKTSPKSGISPLATVYVSRSGHLIHLKPDCSGMEYYDSMTYAKALAAGYKHCSKCF